MRKLLFNIYTVNFGGDYYKTTISDVIQSKAKENIRAKGSASRKEVTVLQEFFYSLEFGDVHQMLLTPRWTELDEQAKQNFLNEHSDLSMLSDAELRTAFENISPKSDWDRFFSDKISSVDFKGIIDIIRSYRNKVAHCKFISTDEYQDCLRVIKQLNDALLEAIKATEDKEFESKNRAYLQKTVKQLADAIQNLSAMYAFMAGEALQSAQSAISSMKDTLQMFGPSSVNSDEDLVSRDASGDPIVNKKDDPTMENK